MKFNIVSDDAKEDVVMREITLDNVYIATYGALVRGRAPKDLDVGESCFKVYSLSGQKPTTYRIVRVE